MKELKDWQYHTFTGGNVITDEFKDFFKDYKNFIKNNLPQGACLEEINREHFYISGFIRKDDKFVYFSTMDVRHFPYSWADNILIRKVKDLKDFIGKENNSTHIFNFKQDVEKLLDTKN